MMYGQMTAGSWIYIGTQGILQGTYETFAALARQRFGGSLNGRLVVTAGLGGMGGAQPLAVTMNEGCALCVEVDLQRIERRIETAYLDERAGSLDDALARLDEARREGRALSIGLLGNAAEVLPELARRGAHVDVVTDQTSAHDPLNGYVPAGLTVEQADVLRASDPDEYLRARRRVGARPRGARSGRSRRRAPRRSTTATRCAGSRPSTATPTRSRIPASSPPTSGRCSARARARSGGSRCRAIPPTSPSPTTRSSTCSASRSTSGAGSSSRASACSSRGCRRGSAGSATASATSPGCASTSWWRAEPSGRPIVIGRDHLDAGSVASPQRETEAMRDGSDAVADWPILNALVNTATGASWVSFHHGGGVGMGKSLHAGQVIVADGTPEAGERIRRTLLADPGMGVVRHADAGYPEALDAAERLGVRIPMPPTGSA